MIVPKPYFRLNQMPLSTSPAPWTAHNALVPGYPTTIQDCNGRVVATLEPVDPTGPTDNSKIISTAPELGQALLDLVKAQELGYDLPWGTAVAALRKAGLRD